MKALAFDPRARRIVAGYEDGAITAWLLPSGERVDTANKGGNITGLTFSADGERLVVGRDENAEIVDPRSMEVLLSISIPGSTAHAAAFSPQGSLVCAGLTSALSIVDSAPPVGGYARRSAARRALKLLDPFGVYADIADAASRLEARTDLTWEDRRDAVTFARAYGINPSQANSEALACVRRSNATRQEYLLALARIEGALPYFPDDPSFLKTKALAHLRLGDPRAAIATIDRAESLLRRKEGDDAGTWDGRSPGSSEFWPAYLMVRAEASHALGLSAQSEDAMRRLRQLVTTPELKDDVEAQNFYAEAEGVVKTIRSRSRRSHGS